MNKTDYTVAEKQELLQRALDHYQNIKDQADRLEEKRREAYRAVREAEQRLNCFGENDL
jgi:hypothetical protein